MKNVSIQEQRIADLHEDVVQTLWAISVAAKAAAEKIVKSDCKEDGEDGKDS
ncbi:MAG: hypothetical protein LUD50_06750 [Clostridia bacterium]|nr:hypothetical protein [Clostridia bacterium]